MSDRLEVIKDNIKAAGTVSEDTVWLIAEVERLREQISAGVSVDAGAPLPRPASVSDLSPLTAPAEPPQPTRPDPGITERKPRR